MNEDKEKICDWIQQMDIWEFYELCSVLEDTYEFTGQQLFFSCRACEKEFSGECNDDPARCFMNFCQHYCENHGEEVISREDIQSLPLGSTVKLELPDGFTFNAVAWNDSVMLYTGEIFNINDIPKEYTIKKWW